MSRPLAFSALHRLAHHCENVSVSSTSNAGVSIEAKGRLRILIQM
jgi:hypothetical protein